MAITLQKQHKLLLATELFLAEYEDLACYPCRFDIALVQRKPTPSKPSTRPRRVSGKPQVGLVTPSPAPENQLSLNTNALDPKAIAPFRGSPSAPSQAMQASLIPLARIGNDILQLRQYLEGAFDAY
jgi:Holliday junction resolvase-like predicted endonuclease